MHVVIRADGSPDIGYGHLVRTGAVAERLLSRGHRVTYATTTTTEATEVCPDGVETVDLSSRGDPEPFLDRFDALWPEVVFTDAYPVDTNYQRAVRSNTSLVVFQDDTRHSICADVFVNGNLYAPSLDYDFLDPHPKKHLGAKYALLRRRISRLATRDPPWREQPQRALVTMGGSDIAGLTPTVVRAFDSYGIVVDAIVGPGFSDEQERSVHEAAANVSADVRVVRDPDGLPERMFQADFAVTTASSTVYELMSLGTPLVCVAVANNQKPIADALARRGAATVVEQSTDEDGFRQAIDGYVSDPQLRRKRREIGRGIVDGRGAKRITDVILSLADN